MNERPPKKRLKVLITAPSLDERENVSGISTLVREIIGNAECDFSHFVAGRKDGEKANASWLVRQLALPIEFLKRLKREKPDLVHINTAFVPLSIMRDAALTFASRFAGVPVLLHPNGGRFLIEDFDNKFLEAVTEKMLRSASRVLVLSDFEKQNLTRRWTDLDIDILPNAISTANVSNEKRETEVKTIVFFGRIHESKGLHEIIEACRKLVEENIEFRFECYGTGPEKEFFLSEMREVLGERFVYGGIVSGKEKWRALAGSDVFLLPSRYGEGLPLAMLEAMAARCVPVVGNVASVRAVIEDGENGFMVEPYSARQTFEKLKTLLSAEADWQKLRENARRTVEENFSIGDYVEKLEKIYRETACREK